MIDAGLVLEGGGMKGIFTAGVLDFFIFSGFILAKRTVVAEPDFWFFVAFGGRQNASHPLNTLS